MNPDEPLQHALERYDEAGAAPQNAAELEAWEDFTLIANHLERTEVLALPADFEQQVQKQVREIQWRRDLVLVLQTAFATGLILTFVAATALGFDWWERLLTLVQSNTFSISWGNLRGHFSVPDLDWARASLLASPLLRLLPVAFLAASIAALLLEIAIFRLLRIGPFQLKPAVLHPSKHSLP